MKEDILIVHNDDNHIVRESYEFVHAKNGLSQTQMNMFYRALTKFTINPEDIDIERRYRVEFQRSEIPKIRSVDKITDELKELQDIRVERVLSSGGWERLIPFPKIGEYENGTIQIWFDGEYLKPILEQKKGYSVFHIAEMFSLNGAHTKRLFEIFCNYKNRKVNTFEFEIELLKEILGIPDKYKNNPSMFLKMVAIPAMEQINEKTSIKVNGVYKRRKGRKPGRVLFSVEHQDNYIELEKAEEVELLPKTEEPKEEQPQQQTIFETPLNEKQHNCVTWLIDKGFTRAQAHNCAHNEQTMKLFYKWRYDNTIDAELQRGAMNNKGAKISFFGELKKHGLRI